jgi:hypothetical protein
LRCQAENITFINSDQWQGIENSTIYQQLPACAQPCVLQVDTTINCWSYGCVCSGPLGSNYEAGLSNVTSCTTNSCKGSEGDAAVQQASNTFQELCQPNFATTAISAVLSTTTSTINGTQISVVTVTAATTATTPTFDSE